MIVPVVSALLILLILIVVVVLKCFREFEIIYFHTFSFNHFNDYTVLASNTSILFHNAKTTVHKHDPSKYFHMQSL